jgi:hypothetical protein
LSWLEIVPWLRLETMTTFTFKGEHSEVPGSPAGLTVSPQQLQQHPIQQMMKEHAGQTGIASTLPVENRQLIMCRA